MSFQPEFFDLDVDAQNLAQHELGRTVYNVSYATKTKVSDPRVRHEAARRLYARRVSPVSLLPTFADDLSISDINSGR